MSGHNARKLYDQCYTTEFIDQQVNPCKYRTYEPYGENTIKCQSLNGPRANKARSTGELGDTDRVFRTDIESQLFNLDVPDSKCITLKTVKEKNERLARIARTRTINYNSCDNNQNYKYSRLEIPVNNFRSIYINRYDYPIIDPVNWVYNGIQNTNQIGNERFGINSQLKAKDAVMAPDMMPFSKLTGRY